MSSQKARYNEQQYHHHPPSVAAERMVKLEKMTTCVEVNNNNDNDENSNLNARQQILSVDEMMVKSEESMQTDSEDDDELGFGSTTSSDESRPAKRRRGARGSLLAAHPHPSSVSRRNERERNRVKQVNMGFATLRQHIPAGGASAIAAAAAASAAVAAGGGRSRKMSKVETLRTAARYINQLQELLREHDDTLIRSCSRDMLSPGAETVQTSSAGVEPHSPSSSSWVSDVGSADEPATPSDLHHYLQQHHHNLQEHHQRRHDPVMSSSSSPHANEIEVTAADLIDFTAAWL